MSQPQLAKQIFAGHSDMAMLMRSHDWSKTSLGSPQQWSQSLKTAVRIMLTSRQPMFVWWGEELINLYNDAYKAIVGGKHPEALGQPAAVVWHEIWDQVGPRAESAMFNNEGTYDEALLLIMERNGYPEETYYTFSYSPIPDDQNGMGGIICANTDDTQRIISERQLTLLRELAAKAADARTFNEACTVSASCLGTNLYDFPFAMIYLVEPDRQQVFLAGTSGIDRNHAAVPAIADLNADSVWSFAKVIKTHEISIISDLEASFGNLPTGAWQQPPHQAVAVPIAPSGQAGKEGILVVGLNPFRLFDDSYRGFIDLVAAQISASIANAQAYEEERKRADALAELDQAKTVFFSNVSHEFRTPLTLMLGPLEETLSNATGLDSGDRQQLTTVHRNALRLLKLVNTLLDFSRIEAGRIQAVYQPTDLARLTADLAGMFRSATDRAGLRLVVDCHPLSEPAYVDPEMWEKIVLNLLSNAFKFTFEGEILVALRNPPDRIELEIRDTGAGIPADELPHIFERFHRVQGAKGRTFEGSGIGLSLVQELVGLHGGTIQVSSIVDQGTSFTVSIPTGSAHLPSDRIGVGSTLSSTAMGATPYVEEILRWLPEKSREGAESLDSAPSLDFYSQIRPLSSPTSRILLVDDNADMRDYLQRLLGQQYEVEAVTDGMAALAAVRQQQPDLVLTDVMMPNLDGFGLLRALRANPLTKELPIILLSARAGEESRIEGLEAGADDYLIKPFSARELLARVEANLKLARLRQETTQREQTQRQEAEAAKEQLEMVLSSIRDQFFVLDWEWRYTYVNRRVVETVGMSREDLLGKSIWELFPALIESEFERQVRWAIAQQTPVHFEYFYPTWSRWFEVHAYPSPEGLTTIFVTEITDRKQAEAALHQSSAILNTINQSTPTLIFVKDRQGRLRMGNPALIRALGKPESEIIGHTDAEFYPNPDDAVVIMENDRQVMETGQMQVLEEVVELPEGRRTFLSTKSPYLDEAGTITGLIGVSFDITDRKQAEELVGRTAALDAFRVALADALRLLADPIEVQATASRLLGERLSANRVVYFEVRGTNYVVERDYVIDAEPLFGNYPIAFFGSAMLAAYRSGRVVISSDVTTDASLSLEEQSAHTAIEIGAYIGIPLIKDGEFVAGLAVHTCGPRSWTPDDVALAEETAERTWAAVERARAEVALQVSETKYRTLFESLDEGFCICELLFDENGEPTDFRFLKVNPVFGKLTGLEQATGKTMREMVPDFEDEWFEIYGRVLRTGEPVRFENQSIAMNRWFDVNAFCIGEPQNNQFAILFNNITGRKQAEVEIRHLNQTLKERVDDLQALLDVVPVGIAIAEDETCKVINVNAFAQSMLSVPPDANVSATRDQAETLPFRQLRDGKEVPGDELPMQLAAAQGSPVRDVELQVVRSDGLTMDWQVNAVPLFDDQAQVRGCIAAFMDITDRKQAEVALQTQAHELSQINKLLMQTTALVNQRNQELDQFTHIVSHDLKAPLRAISNLSTWIEEDLGDQVPPDTKQNLDLLRSRVSRMENMINGLLTYARVGYEEAPDEKIPLQALLLEIIDSLDVPSEFTVQIPASLPILTTNRLLQ